ncbi:MAG: hypothetical protein J7604_26475 [Sporocytophaga sp.]|uniref:hypothetical protein n=1 Tax=Sporocytophaga sp. TaxID=2231183 RepID=UPI001B110BAC|nr:hypothetical protein [Sporocytophaga sp.]MBO9703780.1 hypothetical protein [Sporocytophaga sp.]
MAADVCSREKSARGIVEIILFISGIIVAGTAGWIMGSRIDVKNNVLVLSRKSLISQKQLYSSSPRKQGD